MRELSARYRSLPVSAGGSPAVLRPGESYAFPTDTATDEAAMQLSQLLDEIDPTWRDFVRIWGANGSDIYRS